MKDNYQQAFKEEASELLVLLESSLLQLEVNPDDEELIAKIFRALHTIKGSSGMFGFDDITMFTHDIETVYDQIRNKKLSVNQQIIDYTLLACDQIKIMLNADNEKEKTDDKQTKIILEEFRKLVVKNSPVNTKTEKTIVVSEKESETYYIKFKPARNIFSTGTNPLLLVSELLEFGHGSLKAHVDGIPGIKNLNPEECYTWWDIVLTTSKSTDDIKDVFIFVEDNCELSIEKCPYVVNDELLENLLKHVSTKGNISGFEFNKQKEIKRTELSEKNGKDRNEKSQESEAVTSIRVNTEKLDKLVNLVGELVTVQARLTQTAGFRNDNELTSISEEVERLTWELRDTALNIRMVPIGTTFSKFNRLVRDLSKDLEKEVDLITEGAETELDKSIIDRLNDPLIHIIRNCIDHGIEKPAFRKNLGKDQKGKIFLSASHSGANVVIEISDDGSGLNKEGILNKAKERGLISEDSQLSDKEIYNLIFHPGFSTAASVTNISGRGVGMDVVKKTIESLRGSVEVTSEEGIGTTITLNIPLTLAIIEGLLVSINESYYIIPLSHVEECIELTKTDIKNSHGRNIARVRGELVPYIMLRENFNIPGEYPEIQQIVIINNEKERTGLVVDKVIGEHQTVIKSLGKFYKHVNGVSGATILGDGTVALIIDVNKLIVEAEEKEKVNVLKME